MLLLLIKYVFCLFALATSTQLENELNKLDEDTVDFPITCVTRLYTFRAKVVDEKGKKCEGNVTAVACYGACDTWEYGTEDFPYRVTKSDVCLHDETERKTVELTECQNGALRKHFTYVNAVSCSCQSCTPDKANCLPRPGKKRNHESKRANRAKNLQEIVSQKKHQKIEKPVNEFLL